MKLFRAGPGMRQERSGMRYYQWWRQGMSVEIWTDQNDAIQSVKIRSVGKPIRTRDGIIVGQDSLRIAERKLGSRFLGESESIYPTDPDCWAFYIGASAPGSANWDINYETIICRKGNVEEGELMAAPTNNVSLQMTGFTEPN